MKDDLRNVPPPRVWGAEDYNRMRFPRLERMAKRMKARAAWCLRAIATPPQFLWRLVCELYWLIPSEPRFGLGGAIGIVSAMWGFFLLGHAIGLGKGDWWDIPCFASFVVLTILSGVGVAVLAAMSREKWDEIRGR